MQRGEARARRAEGRPHGRLSRRGAARRRRPVRVKVRPAASADLRAVAGVFLACWRDAYPGVLARDVLDSMDEEAAHDLWRAALGSSGARTEVAEKGESVGGVIRF